MPNLDRFSQTMPWEYKRNHYSYGYEPEVEYEEPILCSCGCKEEIFLDDPDSYIECPLWEDHYYVIGHLKTDKENDQSVGDQSKSN